MAAAWHGGLEGGEHFVNDSTLHEKISLAIDYWFGRDFTNLACLSQGGTSACPCDNPGNLLWCACWNLNWPSSDIKPGIRTGFLTSVSFPSMVYFIWIIRIGHSCTGARWPNLFTPQWYTDLLPIFALPLCDRTHIQSLPPTVQWGKFFDRGQYIGYCKDRHWWRALQHKCHTNCWRIPAYSCRSSHSPRGQSRWYQARWFFRCGTSFNFLPYANSHFLGQHGGVVYNGNYGKHQWYECAVPFVTIHRQGLVGIVLWFQAHSLIPLKHEWCCRPRDWSSSNSACCQHRFPARFCRSFRRWSVDDFPQQSHWGLTLGFRKLFGTTRLTMIYILGIIVCPRPFHFLPGCRRPVGRLFPFFWVTNTMSGQQGASIWTLQR